MKPTKANSQLANKRPFYTKEVMIRPYPPLFKIYQSYAQILNASQLPTHFQHEPYRVCRRPTFLRECSDEKTKIYP